MASERTTMSQRKLEHHNDPSREQTLVNTPLILQRKRQLIAYRDPKLPFQFTLYVQQAEELHGAIHQDICYDSFEFLMSEFIRVLIVSNVGRVEEDGDVHSVGDQQLWLGVGSSASFANDM